MREIKFRAWDKNEEKMIYSDKEYYDYDFRCDEHGNLLCYSNCSWTDTLGDEHDEWVKLDSVMQFTGLKDKNGNDIYEGDICRNKGEMIGEIVFNEFAWMFKWNSGGYYPFGQSCEVISNIHENSELKEVTQ